jgi:hypothetical protein
VAGCYEKLIAADYEKAYALFLVSNRAMSCNLITKKSNNRVGWVR